MTATPHPFPSALREVYFYLLRFIYFKVNLGPSAAPTFSGY